MKLIQQYTNYLHSLTLSLSLSHLYRTMKLIQQYTNFSLSLSLSLSHLYRTMKLIQQYTNFSLSPRPCDETFENYDETCAVFSDISNAFEKVWYEGIM